MECFDERTGHGMPWRHDAYCIIHLGMHRRFALCWQGCGHLSWNRERTNFSKRVSLVEKKSLCALKFYSCGQVYLQILFDLPHILNLVCTSLITFFSLLDSTIIYKSMSSSWTFILDATNSYSPKTWPLYLWTNTRLVHLKVSHEISAIRYGRRDDVYISV